jgi:hypothetical protein
LKLSCLLASQKHGKGGWLLVIKQHDLVWYSKAIAKGLHYCYTKTGYPLSTKNRKVKWAYQNKSRKKFCLWQYNLFEARICSNQVKTVWKKKIWGGGERWPEMLLATTLSVKKGAWLQENNNRDSAIVIGDKKNNSC